MKKTVRTIEFCWEERMTMSVERRRSQVNDIGRSDEGNDSSALAGETETDDLAKSCLEDKEGLKRSELA